MAVVHVKLGPGKLAPHGKKMVAHAMFHKGTHFVAASVLLKDKGGFHDVVLHLLAQGLEVVQKVLLLARDYDKYRPRLRKPLGHDLVLGADALHQAYRLKPMKKEVRSELQALSDHYREHLLRYGGIHDIFGRASLELKVDHVFRRTVALTLLGRRVFK
ncbi:MAG TPA: hypothetical protein DDZ88_06045 [Verrucomicrobiales bacterium]|nr:hypothetical protein [Verrucomicrobiales bacterium]